MGHFLNMFYRSQMDTNGNFSRDNDYQPTDGKNGDIWVTTLFESVSS